MLINAFEFTITAKKEVVAGADDLDLAKKLARTVAKTHHCDVDIVNAFTGEVHQSLVCYVHIAYDEKRKQLKKYYEVKEREW